MLLLVLITSCLLGPCLSGARYESAVSLGVPEGSRLCQGRPCQLPDPVALHLMCPHWEQTVPGPARRLGSCCAHAAQLLNKAGSKSTFLLAAQQYNSRRSSSQCQSRRLFGFIAVPLSGAALQQSDWIYLYSLGQVCSENDIKHTPKHHFLVRQESQTQSQGTKILNILYITTGTG